MNGQPLHVVHVLPSAAGPKGGPGRSVMGLCRALAGGGVQVTLITGDAGSEEADANAGDPGGFMHVRAAHLPLPFEIPGPSMRSVLRDAIGTADLVHIHSVWNGTVTAAAAISRAADRPWIISPRGMLDPDNLARRRWLKRLYYAGAERRTLAGAAGWHFLSDSERERCAWVSDLAGRPFAIVPNGIDVDAVTGSIRSNAPAPLGEGGVHLVFLGRLHPIKGLDLQVEVLERLVARGIDAHLTLVGPDAGAETAIRAAAADRGVGDRLRLAGPVYGDERFRWLRDAGAVLLTSRYEANSNTANETLAAGGLLIATDTCGVDAPAQAGAMVRVPRSAESVTAAILDVLADPDRAVRIRGNAEAYARTRLDWTAIAGAMGDLYRSVLELNKGEHGCAA